MGRGSSKGRRPPANGGPVLAAVDRQPLFNIGELGFEQTVSGRAPASMREDEVTAELAALEGIAERVRHSAREHHQAYVRAAAAQARYHERLARLRSRRNALQNGRRDRELRGDLSSGVLTLGEVLDLPDVPNTLEWAHLKFYDRGTGRRLEVRAVPPYYNYGPKLRMVGEVRALRRTQQKDFRHRVEVSFATTGSRPRNDDLGRVVVSRSELARAVAAHLSASGSAKAAATP